MSKKRRINLDVLGLRALLELQSQGFYVAPQLTNLGKQDLITIHSKKQAEAMEKFGVKEAHNPHKYKVSAADMRTMDGIKFASKTEMLCYQLLKQSGLKFQLQPEFELQPGFEIDDTKVRPIVYKSDFLLGPPRSSATEPLLPGQIVIDVKGMRLPTYMLKRKMFAAKYGRQIVEIPSVSKMKEFLHDQQLQQRGETTG